MPIVLSDEQRSFAARTRSLLARRPRSVQYAHITAATGIPLGWLKDFGQSRFENPKMTYVVALERFLTTNQA